VLCNKKLSRKRQKGLGGGKKKRRNIGAQKKEMLWTSNAGSSREVSWLPKDTTLT
jgi:hypothetical protein